MSYVLGEQRADLFLPPSGQGRVVRAEAREQGRARTQPWQSDFHSSKAHIEETLQCFKKQKTNQKHCSDILFPLMLVSPRLWLILFFQNKNVFKEYVPPAKMCNPLISRE